MADDVEGDWGVIGEDEPAPASVGAGQPSPAKRMRKPFAFNNLFINTKSKFYNLCKPMSKALPDFTTSPVVMLGITYRSSPRVSGKGKASAVRRQQQQQQRTQPAKPPLYTFFNKLSVIPWTEEVEPAPPTSSEILPAHIRSFLVDFRSRLWLTYRSNFPAIGDTTLVTDMGWGCMLRTGQMLLAQALITHYLGRDWRIQREENMMTYRELLRWFADEASPRSPYSIHAIARVGLANFGKQIGDWFEPTTISEALRLLVMQHSPNGLKMYVPKDGIIYRKEVYQLCVVQPADGPSQHLPPQDADGEGDDGLESSTDSLRNSLGNPGMPSAETEDTGSVRSELMSSAESECDETFDVPEQTWHPVVILVPVRLGIQCLNPIYIPTLKAFFAFPQCLGVIGGKPHSSFYFVGHQDNKVLYMDPHFVQPAVKMDDDPLFPIESYRMEIPQAMPFDDIDPSLALGFLCSSQAEFDDFCVQVTTLGLENPCVFSIAEQNSVYKGSSSSSSSSRRVSESCSVLLDEDDEEYVLV